MNFLKYYFILSLILIFPINVYSAVCLGIASSDCSQTSCPERYYDEVVLFPNIDVELCESSDCGDAVSAAVTDEQNKSIYAGGNCQVYDWYIEEGCGVAKAHVVCDEAWVANQPSTTRVSTSVTVVEGVALGGEDAAARSALDSFLTGLGDCEPMSGYVVSQVQKGVSSTSYAYDGQEGVSVVASPFRRCRYTRAGSTMVPLGDLIGSGSGGSGLTQTQTENAVRGGVSGVEDSLGRLEGTATGIKDSLDAGITVNGGLSLADTQTAVEGALDSRDIPNTLEGIGNSLYEMWNPERTYQGGVGGGEDAYINPLAEEGVTLNSVFADFVEDMKGTGMYQLVGSFAGGAPVSGSIAAPVIQIDGGDSYGVRSFDFNNYNELLAIIKTCIILAFVFVAVKLTVINK